MAEGGVSALPLVALIWDVDGTLAETEDEGHRVAFNRAFQEAGLPWHWDRALYEQLLAVTGGKERMRAWWRCVDPAAAEGPGADATIRRLHELKTTHYLTLLDRGAVTLRPGVERLLMQARTRGLRQAIATTTTPDNVRRLLDVTLGPAGRSLFEVVGAGDVVANKKPAGDIYTWVLERLQLPAAACLALEDSAPGVAAALGAGVPVLRVRSVFGAGVDSPGAAAELASYEGLCVEQLAALHAAAQHATGRPSAAAGGFR